jgi:hypothetical protein
VRRSVSMRAGSGAPCLRAHSNRKHTRRAPVQPVASAHAAWRRTVCRTLAGQVPPGAGSRGPLFGREHGHGRGHGSKFRAFASLTRHALQDHHHGQARAVLVFVDARADAIAAQVGREQGCVLHELIELDDFAQERAAPGA